MEPTELRIGNLLFPIHLDGDATVTEIMTSGIGIQSIEDACKSSFVSTEHSHRLEPIPLTKEWLIKFGFELGGIASTMGYTSETFYLNDFCITINIHNGMGYETVGADEFVCFFNKIKYVHQLQNLYFALTAEELTIK